MNSPCLFGQGICQPTVKILSSFCFPDLLWPPLMWLLFMHLKPKKLKPVTVTDPAGFVSPWLESGCCILPEHMQYHRWWWGWASSRRPGIEHHICTDITRKIWCWWLTGLPEALFLTWSPPCSLPAARACVQTSPMPLIAGKGLRLCVVFIISPRTELPPWAWEKMEPEYSLPCPSVQEQGPPNDSEALSYP